MDGREAISSYFMHRGIGGGSPPPAQGVMHGQISGMRPMASGGNLNVHLQSSSADSGNGGGASLGCAFQGESPPSISHHNLNVSGGSMPSTEPVKKKRGRPRKYGTEGNVSLGLSTMSSSPFSGSPGLLGSGSQGPKRGRGRPPGTGRKQLLAPLGEWVMGSAGMGFTPHVIIISVGEDITSKIMSFSQQGPRAVCIMSANGSVSTVTLRQPAASGGTVTYEGRFEILALSGSFMDDGSHGRAGGLSISLSSPDGRVVGGGVGGLLVAASVVQVIVGSFVYAGSKRKSKIKVLEHEQAEGTEHQMVDKPGTPGDAPAAPAAAHGMLMGSWPSSSRQLDGTVGGHIDIDLMHG